MSDSLARSACNGDRALIGPADVVLFDLDGVVVDSRVAFARSVNAALETHGFAPRPEAELHGFIGPPLHGTFAALGAGAAVQSCVEAYRERYVSCCAEETTVFPGMEEVLTMLDPVPLFIVTSKPRALAEPLLQSLGLRERFVGVVGPALETERESKGATLARACKYLPHGYRAVMVGDRELDVTAASEQGIPTVGVLWGIGDERELTEAGAVALARNPAELLAILARESGDDAA